MPTVKTEVTWGNLASIIATIISVGTLVWYMSGALTELRSKDEVHDATLSRIQTERDVRRKTVDDKIEFLFRDRERLSRVEEQIKFVAEGIRRIEAKLDRTNPSQP